ncbi:uncharacterized protein VTP21DRAFT_3122 [Calcarisporiella thermophila]|uniref:uncharacterized protein n=1 Tax=Calcarisporiella thermophila TaxID=911321 RepID=UPI0037424083
MFVAVLRDHEMGRLFQAELFIMVYKFAFNGGNNLQDSVLCPGSTPRRSAQLRRESLATTSCPTIRHCAYTCYPWSSYAEARSLFGRDSRTLRVLLLIPLDSVIIWPGFA